MPWLSSNNQITIPDHVLRDAGLKRGDSVVARAAGPGRIEVERVSDVIARHAGALSYPPGTLQALRDEWDR